MAVLLAASLLEFSVRGTWRAAHSLGWNDFLSPYIQANAWLHSKDPYDAKVLVSLWPAENSRPLYVDTEAANGTLEQKRGMPSPYPLPTLVVLSPFAFLKWFSAVRLWIIINTVSVLAALFSLIMVCRESALELRSLAFLAVALALAPLHTGLATANPAVLSINTAVLSFASWRSGRPKLAAILLAIAICLKPTVAAGLLLYFLLCCEWKIAGVATGLAATIGVVGIARLRMASVPWLTSYNMTSRRMFGPGSLDDFARFDPIRFNMINGQVFFYSLLKNASAANLLAWLLTIAMLGVWLRLFFRRGSRRDLLEVAAISVLTLIPLYHRFYDAWLLVWPLGWSLLRARKRSVMILSVVLALPFLVPGPILLDDLQRAGRIPPWFVDRWWWSAGVLSHEVLDLILWAVVLLYWMSHTSSEEVESDPVVSPQTSLIPHSAQLLQ